MDILLIIYIFALFIIFSPNFLFKYSQSNNIYTSLIHAFIFSIVIYITYNSVVKSETEGATIGSFNKNNEHYPLTVNEMNLGTINAETPTTGKPQDIMYNNEIIVSTPNTAEEQRLTSMPPYDYSNFRTYDYENMKKKIEMLETHQHTNHYFDLVPNFNSTKHEILCAADYGTNKPCCRQPNADIPEINQCGALKPYCQDYIAGVQWGKCVAINPYPKPNLVYDGPKNITTTDKNNVVVKDTTGKNVSVDVSSDGSIIVPNCPSNNSAIEPFSGEIVNLNVYENPWKQPMISSIEIYQQPTNSPKSSLTKEGDTVVYTYSSDMNSTTDMFILRNSSDDKLIKYNVSIKSNVNRDASTPPPNASTPPPNASTLPVTASTPPPNASTPPPNASTPPPNAPTPPFNASTLPSSVVKTLPYVKKCTPSTFTVAVGKGNNTIACSEDGKTWKGLGNVLFEQGYGVAWNGKMWVAVGLSSRSGNTANTIAYCETDPMNLANWWGLGTTVFSGAGRGVAWNGSMWVAVGTGQNSIAWSYDGKNWNGLGRKVLGGGGYGVACNGLTGSKSMWVATGSRGGGGGAQGGIAYSTDGKNWFVAQCKGGVEGCATKGTGSNRLTRGLIVFGSVGTTVAWNGKIWVAGGSQGANDKYQLYSPTIAWSEDGKNWFGVSNSNQLFANICTGLAWNGNMWLATGYSYRSGAGQVNPRSAGNKIARSQDGKNWTIVNNTLVFGSSGMAWNGSLWITGGSNEYYQSRNKLSYSEDGVKWFGLGQNQFSINCTASASKNVLPYTTNWANCQ